MKKTTITSVLLMLLAMILLPAVSFAQGMEPLPVDPQVRVGHLPNGLTYYIRHNEYPKGQADFYIAQNVGSALEEDNQRGLAHFLEHMCFNGTTHFPDNQLRDWLTTVGVRFGENLNAYTSIDETVYNISNVPVARTGVQDSCLLILHDWANDLTLDPAEIDKERGVIHEEWRQSNKGQMRVLERILPDIYPTTRYGHRLPIGTMEVVDNFPPQALRDYYESWYRPDQQAIIVVGDIDPDRIEAKIKEIFSDIEMPANAPERKYEPVPDHKGTLYGIGQDPEIETLEAELMFISDPMPKEYKNTVVYYMTEYMQQMIASMLNQRLSDIASTPDAPFATAGVYFSTFFISKTKDAFTISATAKGGEVEPAIAAAYREVLRAARGGFNETEYDRARSQFMSRMEKQYNDRNTRESGAYVKEYVDAFTDGEPIPGIEIEYELLKQLTPMVSVDMINAAFKETITDDNRVVLALGPEKEGYATITKEGIEAALAAVDAENIEAFVDNMRTDPLIAKMPKAGKIVKIEQLPLFDAQIWTLSNGAKVVVKTTKFKEDEILFTANAPQGTSKYGSDYDKTLKFLGETGNYDYGLGTYTRSDLKKYLQGKIANLRASADTYERGFSGVTTPKDLPTLMELIYASFTSMNYDANEFAALQQRTINDLKNQDANPQFQFVKALYSGLFKSPRRSATTVDDVEGASLAQANKILKEMTANAADYTFIFVGNIDPEALKPLVCQYIASLPGNAKKAAKPVVDFDPAEYVTTGENNITVTTPMATPQTWVAIVESGKLPFNFRNRQLATIMGQILTKRLINTVREEMGAVYSIHASGQMSRRGLSPVILQCVFPMKPEMKDTVLTHIKNEIASMATNVTDDELNPVKEYLVKTYTEAREKNNPWMLGIQGYMEDGIDTFNNAVETVNAITIADVMQFVADINAQGNYTVVVLDPEPAAE